MLHPMSNDLSPLYLFGHPEFPEGVYNIRVYIPVPGGLEVGVPEPDNNTSYIFQETLYAQTLVYKDNLFLQLARLINNSLN